MSKENNVLELFYNEPTKHWHFEDILKTANISRPQAMQWIRKFRTEGLIKRVKPRNKMPYYLGNYTNANYQIKKRLYALHILEISGFFESLLRNPHVSLAILFGSFSRWDWYKDSDIDLFVIGSEDELAIPSFVDRRSIDLFYYTAKSISEIPSALLQNIREGFCIKGNFKLLNVQNTK